MKDTGPAEWCKFVRYGQHRSYLEAEWVMKTNYYPLPYFFSILRPNQPHLLEARWRSWTGSFQPGKTIRFIPLRDPCETWKAQSFSFYLLLESRISPNCCDVNELKIWIKNLAARYFIRNCTSVISGVVQRKKKKAPNKFLNFRARWGERERGRHPRSLCIHGNERAKNSLRFSRVVLRQTSSAEGRGKKEGCAGSLVTRPFSFFLFFLLNLSETVRKFSETKGKARGLACTVRGLFFVFLFLPPSVSPS